MTFFKDRKHLRCELFNFYKDCINMHKQHQRSKEVCARKEILNLFYFAQNTITVYYHTKICS